MPFTYLSPENSSSSIASPVVTPRRSATADAKRSAARLRVVQPFSLDVLAREKGLGTSINTCWIHGIWILTKNKRGMWMVNPQWMNGSLMVSNAYFQRITIQTLGCWKGSPWWVKPWRTPKMVTNHLGGRWNLTKWMQEDISTSGWYLFLWMWTARGTAI